MKRRLLISCLALLALTGCQREEHRDLQNELDERTKTLRGKIDPLPVVKPYEAVPYLAFDLPDPFGPEKIALAIRGKGTGGPDQTRAREPLEAYSLESLKMVGTLQQHNRTYALVKADAALYKVQVGNYMGQSYGMVTQINETEIALKEWVQDAAGDWSERDSALMLQDAEGR